MLLKYTKYTIMNMDTLENGLQLMVENMYFADSYDNIDSNDYVIFYRECSICEISGVTDMFYYEPSDHNMFLKIPKQFIRMLNKDNYDIIYEIFYDHLNKHDYWVCEEQKDNKHGKMGYFDELMVNDLQMEKYKELIEKCSINNRYIVHNCSIFHNTCECNYYYDCGSYGCEKHTSCFSFPYSVLRVFNDKTIHLLTEWLDNQEWKTFF